MSVESFDALTRSNGASRVAVPAEQVTFPDPPTSDDVPTTAQTDPSGDLTPPYEAQFNERDFLPAPGLRRAATTLIMRDNRLRHLTGVHIEYLWKRRGGRSRGQDKIGECAMPAGLSKHAWNQMAIARSGSNNERVVFVVWLAADHLETFTPVQVEASLYRQLLKTTTDERDHSEYKLRAPDFVGFVAEIERYGLWNQSLVAAAPAFKAADEGVTQPGLPLASDDPWSEPGETTTDSEPSPTPESQENF